MKILWVKTDFLHPTNRGGQIRTLETLRWLHRWHEVHYVALHVPGQTEGIDRASEYSARAYPIPHIVPPKPSAGFLFQIAGNLFSPLPLAVSRYRSRAMQTQIARLLSDQSFDSLVCDFLFPAPNIPDLSRAVLFQHNVETVIWQRHVQHAPDPLRRSYLRLQENRMRALEQKACRRSGLVIAVSEKDAQIMRDLFHICQVEPVPTGVDTDYFARRFDAPPVADFVFVGSMDWHANVDGIFWFLDEIWPLITARQPEAKLAIVGRTPPDRLRRRGDSDPSIIVTGTVPDVRPYLWGSTISIIPLRVGGGTRLKIFEAMAAGVPVISTTVGAEGLPLEPGVHLEIADQPGRFAAACLQLLDDRSQRTRLATAAHSLVSEKFGWEASARHFSKLLERGPRP